MYGLVNKGIKGYVVELGGEQAWAAIVKDCSCDTDEFITFQPYSDELTYSLVAAAASHFELSVDDVLKGFGRHWILFTAAQGYSSTLDLYGNDMLEFLMNLDEMHTRIQLSMPELRMPRFNCVQESSGGDLIVDYSSDRKGLESMVHGLLEGIAERFEQSVTVERIESSEGVTARFRVRSVGAVRNVA